MSVSVLLLVCAISCPLLMGLMMLFMRRDHHDREPKNKARE